MNVREFSRNPGAALAEVERTGQPLDIETRGRSEYTTIVRTEDWQRAERALSVVQGLMAIARADQGRAEDCDQYRRFAEMLFKLDDQLQLSTDDDRQSFAAMLRYIGDGEVKPIPARVSA